jgi:aminoglycoside phosphotransferase (APT) family kinase protein
MPARRRDLLDQTLAARIVSRFDPTVRVERVFHLDGSASGGVYGLTLSTGHSLVLKLYDASSPWQVEQEEYVYELLRAAGLPVPDILHHDNSNDLLPYGYILMTKLPGTIVAHAPHMSAADYQAIYQLMGKTLNTIHTVDFPRFGYIARNGMHDAYEYNADFMRVRFERQLHEFSAIGGDRSLVERTRELVAASHPLFESCSRAVLCHNDLHEANLLVERAGHEWRLTGLIDVNGAIAADPLFDFARTDFWSTRGDPLKRAALRAGADPLSTQGEDLVRVYNLYHAIELALWFMKHAPNDPDLDRLRNDIAELSAR